MKRQREWVLAALGASIAGVSGSSCGPAAPEPDSTEQVQQRSVTTPQTALDGSTIPQFVSALTTLQATRVDGTQTVNVDMEEFQQKILPPQFYPQSGRFAAGTYLWGYNIDGHGPSWPGRTIQSQQNVATTAIYSNSIRGPNGAAPVLQQFLTTDLTIHWADPVGESAKNHCIQGDENGGDTFTPPNEDATNDAGVIGGTQNARTSTASPRSSQIRTGSASRDPRSGKLGPMAACSTLRRTSTAGPMHLTFSRPLRSARTSSSTSRVRRARGSS